MLTGKRELVALLGLSSWCPVIVDLLFLAVPWVCLQYLIVFFPDVILLLFLQTVIGLTIKHSVCHNISMFNQST